MEKDDECPFRDFLGTHLGSTRIFFLQYQIDVSGTTIRGQIGDTLAFTYSRGTNDTECIQLVEENHGVLPVHGVQECKLFDTLIVHQGKGPIDFLKMVKEWCTHVDGVHVFPKLPVYLRTWYTK